MAPTLESRVVSTVQLALVLLRIYAITLLVAVLDYAASGALNLFWDASVESEFDLRAHGIAAIAVAFVRIAVAVYLLVRTASVARFVCRGTQDAASGSALAASDVAVLGFGILGLWLVVEGVHGAVHSYANWRSELRHDPTSGFPFGSSTFLASVVRAAAGLWLFLGARGVARVAGWVRRAGAPQPPTPPTPPA